MTLLGMDPVAVRRLATEFTDGANRIRQLVGSLSSQIGNAHWVGADREQLVDDWTRTYVPRLNVIADALEAASTCAVANAAQQEQASGTGGGSSAGDAGGVRPDRLLDPPGLVVKGIHGLAAIHDLKHGISELTKDGEHAAKDAEHVAEDGAHAAEDVAGTAAKDLADGTKGVVGAADHATTAVGEAVVAAAGGATAAAGKVADDVLDADIAKDAVKVGEDVAKEAPEATGFARVIPGVSAVVDVAELGDDAYRGNWDGVAYDATSLALDAGSEYPPAAIAGALFNIAGMTDSSKDAIGHAEISIGSSYVNTVMHPYQGGITANKLIFLSEPVTAAPIIDSAAIQAGARAYHALFG